MNYSRKWVLTPVATSPREPEKNVAAANAKNQKTISSWVTQDASSSIWEII
jgi:hypothetical protein